MAKRKRSFSEMVAETKKNMSLRKKDQSESQRKFKPTRKYCGDTMVPTQVSHWIWLKGKGLQVHFIDGRHDKSEYKLSELLSGQPEGPVREVK